MPAPDAEVDGKIKDAEQANKSKKDEWEEEWEEEAILLKPSRWWFASTACPLIAGTFGPMANAFNICAIVQYWREYIPPGAAQGQSPAHLVQDPHWLLGINGVALAMAVIANTFLMLNMVNKIRFSIAQPITVIGFFISSFILIALVSVANTSAFRLTVTVPGGKHALTQGYYFACFAAGIYFIMASLMIFTVYGAITGKYQKEFEITGSQRTLMMQTISLMAYMLVGAAIYTAIEGWDYNDAIYWSIFTLLTIGIGDDLVPVTHTGRSLLIIYTFGGILAVGLVISSMRSMLLEKGSQKMQARTVEKNRQRVHTLDDLSRHKKNEGPPPWQNERERREAEFHAMRHIQDRTATRNRYRALAISTFNAAVLWFVGAVVFYYSEQETQGWSYFEAIYFSYVTLITLGYGDLQPLSNAGRAFFVLWALLAIPTLTVLISDMSDTVVKGVSDATNLFLGSTALLKRIKKLIAELSGGRVFKAEKQELKRERTEEDEEKGRKGRLEEMLYHRLNTQEQRAIDEFAETTNESVMQGDVYFFHYVLVKEIQNVLKDTTASPPKRYTYDEWAYYLKLLGHDEEDSAYHAERYNKPKKDDEQAPQVARILDHEGNPRPWAWLSLRSPLIGLGNEADWILKRLLNKLQGELKFQGKPGRGTGHQPPPFSINALRGHHGLRQRASDHPTGMSGRELKELESTFG